MSWLLLCAILAGGVPFFAFLILLYIMKIPSYRTYKMAQKIHGPNKMSLVGVAVDLANKDFSTLLPYLDSMCKEYPGVARAWMLGIPMVILQNAEDLETVMGNVQHSKKGLEYELLSGWLNEGLLLSDGVKWKRRRKLLTPSFHFKILENNLTSLNKHARRLVQNLTENKDKPVDVLSNISLCTLDIICETAMGLTVNAQDQQGKEYLDSVYHVSEGILFRFQNIYLKDWMFGLTPLGRSFNKHVKKLHKYTENVIRERKELYRETINKAGSFSSGQKQRHAFLDMLIEMQSLKQGVATDLDIREEVDTFMFEGHDTTSSALTFALLRLANHPDVQEKVYEEQLSIFGDSERAADNQDLQQMTYLTKVIKETLRIYPSVPYMTRQLTHDAKCGNTIIPEGSNVLIVPYLLHRNEEYYPNPLHFDPERFAPDEIVKRHPFAYIPFSAGPRNCIGQKFAMMELKVVLSTVIRNCKLEPVTKVEDLVLVPLVILRSQEPILVKFIKRR